MRVLMLIVTAVLATLASADNQRLVDPAANDHTQQHDAEVKENQDQHAHNKVAPAGGAAHSKTKEPVESTNGASASAVHTDEGKKAGLSGWVVALIVIGALVVFCCGCFALLYLIVFVCNCFKNSTRDIDTDVEVDIDDTPTTPDAGKDDNDDTANP